MTVIIINSEASNQDPEAVTWSLDCTLLINVFTQEYHKSTETANTMLTYKEMAEVSDLFE